MIARRAVPRSDPRPQADKASQRDALASWMMQRKFQPGAWKAKGGMAFASEAISLAALKPALSPAQATWRNPPARARTPTGAALSYRARVAAFRHPPAAADQM
jgi:hypothetical protein